MTNTYDEQAPMTEKVYEEIRCLRCVNERILRVMSEGLFVDYQMEKFFGKDKHMTPEDRAFIENYLKRLASKRENE